MNSDNPFEEMDWALLRQQKAWLIGLALPGKEQVLADGIVALLDHIQDWAVEQGALESVIFNLKEQS